MELLEARASLDGEMLRGTVLQEGRAAAGGRAEVFAPGSCTWPSEGIELLTAHRRRGGRPLCRVPLERQDDGRLTFETPATAEIRSAYREGLSVEFLPAMEHRTAAGVREIELALVGAAAFTAKPEYAQAKAEIRVRRTERRW